jgi:muconolactone delta-isomerase
VRPPDVLLERDEGVLTPPIMEYLVNMTTSVPSGTSESAVEDIRTREAAHSRELAAEGHLLRLWRPPLQPGEWRSLGLFAADDGAQLEQVLASMPLRVWRTDEVTPLSPHPNDPPATSGETRTGAPDGAMEFLTTFATTVPGGTSSRVVEETEAAEAERAHELAEQGHLARLWALPGERRALGLWRAQDADEMQAVLNSLPLYSWMAIQTTPLHEHPSDPALTQS